MPVSKLSSKTITVPKSDRLVLAEHISRCTSAMERFIESTQNFQEYKTDVFINFDRQLEAKTQELKDITQQINSDVEDIRIKTKQKLQEFKRDAAIEVLNETNEVPISAEELEEMQTELEELRTKRDETIQDAVNKVRNEEIKSSQNQLNNMKLQHTADIATLKAISEQRIKEVDVLHQTIVDLKHELAEQRELTKSVASSLKSGAITLNAGKN